MVIIFQNNPGPHLCHPRHKSLNQPPSNDNTRSIPELKINSSLTLSCSRGLDYFSILISVFASSSIIRELRTRISRHRTHSGDISVANIFQPPTTTQDRSDHSFIHLEDQATSLLFRSSAFSFAASPGKQTLIGYFSPTSKHFRTILFRKARIDTERQWHLSN